MKAPSSIISDLLFREVRPPRRGTGRLIKFSDGEPDIEIVTGTMSERVLALLATVREPMTASEIARGIGSNASRVSATLKRLIDDEQVLAIMVEGCVREYINVV